MRLLTRFPDIFRYLKVEATRTRLWAGCITTQLICLSIYLAVHGDSLPGKKLYATLLSMQTVLLLLYGTLRLSGSIANERAEKTWDTQRMTPLTSYEIAIGKLIGAPLFAYFLFAVSLPWSVFSLFLPGAASPIDFLLAYRMLFGITFLLLSLGLLISAYSDRAKSSSTSLFGVLFGFYALIVFSQAMFNLSKTNREVSFYGFLVDANLFSFLSSMLFGAWAFFGAKWRLGLDLLEKKKIWRLPAFLFVLTGYVFGLNFQNAKATYLPVTYPESAAIASCFFLVFCAALLRKEDGEYWRRWLLQSKSEDILHGTPIWLTGWATTLMMALMIAVTVGVVRGWSLATGQILILFVAFLGRDLCFLQWCRLTKSRRPEMMAIVYILLAYLLPSILLSSFHLTKYLFIFLPHAAKEGVSFDNVFPSVLQLAIMGTLLYRQLMKSIENKSSVEHSR